MPQPLPVEGRWRLESWQEDEVPADLAERIQAQSARAVRLRLRSADGDEPLQAYGVEAERGLLRWRIRLTLKPSGEEWRARAADDALASLFFTRLRLG